MPDIVQSKCSVKCTKICKDVFKWKIRTGLGMVLDCFEIVKDGGER